MSTPVSELSALKYENFIYKLQIAENEMKVTRMAMAAHVDKMRKEVGADEHDMYDPNTHTFKPVSLLKDSPDVS